jgi:molybdate transport system substrate-binding protein
MSLRTALDEVGDAWAASTGGRAKISYGTTLALAQQIDAGAPVDVFISGDPDWMDYLDGRGVVKSETVMELLGNRLVLVAPARSEVAIEIAPGFDLRGLLGDGRLAIPDTETLPAGRYGKQALTALGVWDEVVGQTAQTESMRAATTLVAAGEAALGIVYITEAAADRGLRIVDTFPEKTHAPIIYKAAETAESSDGDAASFLGFLRTRRAANIFEESGFVVLAPVVGN